jgi:hypothetical protein
MSRYLHNNHAKHFTSLTLCPLSSNGSGAIEKDYFYWEFDVKPSTFSRVYRVLLIWDFSKNNPQVYILNEEVHKVANKRVIPHLYSQEKIQLCLFKPSYNQFSMSMSLCETIIPWTYLWISYYEEWLYSDEWKGGGIHPESTKEKKLTSPSKKVKVNARRVKNKKYKKLLVDKIYEKRKKNYLKNNPEF